MDAKEREALANQLRKRVSADVEQFARPTRPAAVAAAPLSVGDLKDLQWVADTLSPAVSVRRRWPLVTVFCITALVLTVLLGTPSSTRILLRATTAAIAFEVAKSPSDRYLVANELPIKSLMLIGATTWIPLDALPANFNATAGLSESDWRDLRIEHIYMRTSTTDSAMVRIQSQPPTYLQLCVEHGDLFVDLAGAAIGNVPPRDAEVLLHIAQPPANAQSSGASAEACIRWDTPNNTNAPPLLANFPVTALHVSGTEVRVAGDDDRGDVFPSALRSAQLRFPDAPGLKYTFETDERLGLTHFHGLLRSVSLAKGLLEVQANGSAAGITRSTGAPERSLAPSRLTLLRTKYSELWFAWGFLLYIVGLVTAFLTWRGIEV